MRNNDIGIVTIRSGLPAKMRIFSIARRTASERQLRSLRRVGYSRHWTRRATPYGSKRPDKMGYEISKGRLVYRGSLGNERKEPWAHCAPEMAASGYWARHKEVYPDKKQGL
jgi:hypothetical protein